MPIPMDNFSAGEIYYGTYKGEESYYRGQRSASQLKDTSVTTEPGFIVVTYL